MAKWKGIVGEAFTPEEFREYVAGLTWGSWWPDFIVLHHTAIPSLAQRPDGFNQGSMSGLTRYYRDELGWSAGPHLFVDDHQIWVFTPLTTPGVHAKSFNSRSLGVEMLGNYDVEAFNSGRGALVRDNAVAAIAILTAALGIDPASMVGHRDEPSTTKTCPGGNVDTEAFIWAVRDYLVGNYPEFSESWKDFTWIGEGSLADKPAPKPEEAPADTTDALLGEAWGVQNDPARPGPETGEPAPQVPPAVSYYQPGTTDPAELIKAREYLPIFQAAADAYQWPEELEPIMQQALGPAWMVWVLMGIASRESRMGLLLDVEGKGDGGHGHGIMQIDDRSHSICQIPWRTLAGSLEYVHHNVIIPSFNYLGEHCWEQVGEDYGNLFRATISAYNAGPGNVRKALEAGAPPDSVTTGRDYAQDVMSRAKAFKEVIE